MADTIIGSALVVDGEISGQGALVVRGRVKGKISLEDAVIVEPSGVVEADIESRSATIAGQVKGSVAASEKVELRSEGKMSGNIKSPRIQIAEGASFHGNVEMGG
jgi:cytoskeletal protein CcmA (bactofilin family)